MSEYEDNSSDFDEDNDDPDRMIIPSSLAPMATKLISVPSTDLLNDVGMNINSLPNTLNSGHINMNTIPSTVNNMRPVSISIPSQVNNVKQFNITIPSAVISNINSNVTNTVSNIRQIKINSLSNAGNNIRHINLNNIRPNTVNNVTVTHNNNNNIITKNNIIKVQKLGPSAATVTLASPVMQGAAATQFTSPGVTAASSPLLRVVRPYTAKVTANTPRFQVIKTNGVLASPLNPNKVIQLPPFTNSGTVAKLSNTNTVHKISPPLIDLTDSPSCTSVDTTTTYVGSTANHAAASPDTVNGTKILASSITTAGGKVLRILPASNGSNSNVALRTVTASPSTAMLVTRTGSPMAPMTLAKVPQQQATWQPTPNATAHFRRLRDGTVVKIQGPPGGGKVHGAEAPLAVTTAIAAAPVSTAPSSMPATTQASTAAADLLSAAIFSSGVFDIPSGTVGSNSDTISCGDTTNVSGEVGGLPGGITFTIGGDSTSSATALQSMPITASPQPLSLPSTATKTVVTVSDGRTIVTTGSQASVDNAMQKQITRFPSVSYLPRIQGTPIAYSVPSPLMQPFGGAARYVRTPNGGFINPGQLLRCPRLINPSTSVADLMPGNFLKPDMFAAMAHQLDEMEEDDGAMGIAETFANYKPTKLTFGRPHPDSVVESASMASVEPPDIKHTLRLPDEVIDECRLSALQLETIVYVGQKHDRMLPDQSRAGFLIGDGAGVGKGRTIAGIIYDNYIRGRKRSIWVSASNDLKYDAERDLKDIGASNIKVKFLSKMKYAKIRSEENGNMKKGVLFATYSALIGESTSSGKYSTRMKQILDWCGNDFDGCIIFDECHRAKNLCPVESSKPTKTGRTVLDLQNKLPKARVVYASATGASEPKNMAYMVRLGLWGTGTPFETFNNFIATVDKRGVGAMEIVAMDMKLRGMYIARQLSFHGVTFKIEEAPLTAEFKGLYNDSVRLWVRARESFQKAANLLTAESNVKKSMWGQFWSAHQRFFKYLCIASKVETAVKLSYDSRRSGRCVVIGLQSTGEARTLEQLDRDGELNDFVSTAKGVLETLVEKHFPASDADRVNRVLALARRRNGAPSKRKKKKGNKKSKKQCMDPSYISSSGDEDDDGSGSECSFDEDDMDNMYSKFLKTPSTLSMFNRENDKYNSATSDRSSTASPVPNNKPNLTSQDSIDSARELKNKLVRQINGLGKRLPPNTLDQLINELGGTDEVAEMTGRKGRVVQSYDGDIAYETRAGGDVAHEMLNLSEKESFMNGDKLVAIISEAASSGISLQSDRRVANQRRRVHITLELPWSADRAIQQFGRTHRSNQVNAPEYIFVISMLAGERRFASIVAKRLECMGALTHGDRRTADTRDLSSFNIDNQYGRDALYHTMTSIINGGRRLVPLPTQYEGNFLVDVKPALVGCGLAAFDGRGNYSLEKDSTNMTKFLNRILGMPVDLQNSLFQYFTDTLTAITIQAKNAGKFDKGILDLCVGADGCKSTPVRDWSCSHSTGMAKTTLHRLQVERGMSWQQANEKANMLRIQGEGFYKDTKESGQGEGFYLSKRIRKARKSAILAVLDPSAVNGKRLRKDQLYSIYKPNLGLVVKQERYQDIKKKFDFTKRDDMREHWEEQHEVFLTTCAHVFWTGVCDKNNSVHKCEFGLRMRTYHVLCGSVLNVWGRVEDVLLSDPQNPRFHRLQVVRFKTDNSKKHVGTLIPNNMVKKVIDVLNAEDVQEAKAPAPVPDYFTDTAVFEDDDDDDIMILPD